MKRFAAGFVLALSLALVAFALGTFIGGRFIVEPGSGLAGPAVAIGYGVMAAVVALVLGVWIASRMSWIALARTSGVLGVAALCLCVWIVVRMRQERARAETGSTLPVSAEAEPTAIAEPVASPLPPDDLDGRPDSIVGLLAIPTFFDPPDGEAMAARSPLPLHDRAPAEMRVRETVSDPARMEAKEYGYEESGAVVYAVFDDWYRVGLADGSRAWVRGADAGDWHPIETLLIDGLAYLTDAWDGQLRPAPADGAPTRRVRFYRADEDEFAADVKQVRTVNGRLWLRVAVFAESPCEGGDPAVADEGWLPAYAPGGRLTAWFHSRGC
jgi:hypothetical protein